MISTAGIFTDRGAAERVAAKLRGLGIENVALLTPGRWTEQIARVHTAETEAPGMGRAVGTLAGSAVGVGAGLSLGTAAVSFVVPGVGHVLGLGALAAVILGLIGARSGGAIGKKMDGALLDGLPKDEIFVYEDALRQGRSVVICMNRDHCEREEAWRILEREGAESVDAARHRWWTGVRDAEREHYQATGGKFETDEDAYRRGFEAALNPEFRGRTWEQVSYVVVERYPDWSNAHFRQGFERGRRHYAAMVGRHLAA